MISRRGLITSGALVCGSSIAARAQECPPPRETEILLKLSVAEQAIFELHDTLLDSKERVQSEGSDGLPGDAIDSTLTQAGNAAESLLGVDEGALSNYVAPAEFDLAQLIEAEPDVSLVPDPEATASRPVALETQDECANETTADVLVDIVCEAILGVPEIADRFETILDILGLGVVWDEMVTAVRSGDMARAGRKFEKILRALFTSRGAEVITEVVGRETYRKLLRRVAAKLVPFIGWILLAASFVSAIWSNWERIQCTIGEPAVA